MERCYEYLGCRKNNCIMFNISSDKQCWETKGTLCNSQAIEIAKDQKDDKMVACKMCIYYKAVNQ